MQQHLGDNPATQDTVPIHATRQGGRRLPVWPALGALLFLGLSGAPASAASYYFSNCAQGGAGTLANPYCLDPDGSGKKASIAYLMDGVAPDVGPGDTIYLCAGACDGTGTATYNLGVQGTTTSGTTYAIAPVVSGTQASPITIQAYPGETVILSGDTNGNGVADATEPDDLVTNLTTAGANKAWYVWKNLTFERIKTIAFYLNANPANWTFDNIEVRYVGPTMWSGQDLNAVGCDNQQNNYAFKVADLAAPLTIRNSRFHHICGFAHRNTVNDSTTASMLIEKNEYYNVSDVSNDFIGRNVTYRGNYVHDCIDGIGVEENMKNVVLEDNVFSCPGVYKVTPDGRCYVAIDVDDGNNGTGGTTKGITIRRNRIYGTVDGQFGGTTSGWFLCPLQFTATNTTESINSVIENNMIWHVWSPSSSELCAAGIGVNTNRSEVTIQNNTVYDATYGIAADATVAGVAYTIRNNLLVRANKNGSNRVELWIGPNAANSSITYNNLDPDGQGDPVMTIAGTNYNCNQIASFQTGNKCGSASFVKTSGAVNTWDLHLASTDTSNRDVWTVGPTDDIDKGARNLPSDIGADEYGSVASSAPTAAVTLTDQAGQAVPVRTGIFQLKAGTYGVKVVTTAPVVAVPTPLTFTDSGGHAFSVTLSGTTPGVQFTGTLTVDASVVEGSAAFSLGTGALDDGQGNVGNQIASGNLALVDMTPPAAPKGVATQ
jgi:hypothetical protein